MQNPLMELVEKTSMKESVPKFEIGDTVDVHVRAWSASSRCTRRGSPTSS
jgi:hypothetical protein